MENRKDNQLVPTLVRLTMVNGDVFRFQNLQPDPYYYIGEEFEFLGFKGGITQAWGLGLGSAGGRVSFGNNTTGNPQKYPVRDWLERYQGLTRARIEVMQIWPEDLLTPPLEERHEVRSSGIDENGEVILVLKGPADADTVRIPSLLLTKDQVPELPSASPGRI